MRFDFGRKQLPVFALPSECKLVRAWRNNRGVERQLQDRDEVTDLRFVGGGMPWKDCHIMDERFRFVARLLEGEKMAPLCAEFGISWRFLSKPQRRARTT
jgi:hypothetical protein